MRSFLVGQFLGVQSFYGGAGFLELRAFHGLLVVGSFLVVQFFGVQLFYGGGRFS